MPDYVVKPNGLHHRFLSCKKKVQIFGGGFGNGKTAAACIKAIKLARDYPGSNGFVGMATYAQLNDTIRKELYKWIPNSAVKRWPSIADNTLKLHNGSMINFRYLQQKGKSNPDGTTTSNLLSATYDWAVVDQIENPLITYKDFLDLLGRLRGTTPYKGKDPDMPLTGPRFLVLTANPSFNWFYHKIIKPYHVFMNTGRIIEGLLYDYESGEPIVEVFEGPTHENAHNLPEDFIKTMENVYTGQFRDRFLSGQWGAFEGLVYPDFDQVAHCIPRTDMVEYLIRASIEGRKFEAIEGYDYGLAEPMCYLFGFKDDYGRIFILDGFYEKEYPLHKAAKQILDIQFYWSRYLDVRDPIMADPAIWKRTVINQEGLGATTIKNILSAEPYDLSLKPGQNDIINGITKVASYLGVKSFPHFLDPTKEAPIIFFADDLDFIPDEFGAYFWKANEALERIDVPIDRKNHALDTLKYILSYLPPAHELLFARTALNDDPIRRFAENAA